MKKNISLVLTVMCATLLVSSCMPKHKKAYMRHAYKNIKRSVPSAEVVSLNDTIKVLFPANLMFAVNKSNIDSAIQPSMKRFASALNKYNRTAILISGYTDSLGSEEYNDKLSSQRADTAKHTLVNYEVKDSRINTWGMGERHPIASNATEEGRSKNRRVEFVILFEAADK